MSVPRARLVFVTGSRSGSSIVLRDGVNTIGRRADSDIPLSRDEVLVSGEHADVTREGDRWIVRDRDSRNGTFVNREQVTERELKPGDVIEFGLGGPSAQFLVDSQVGLTPTLDLSDGKTPERLRRLAEERISQPSGRRFSNTREFVALTYRRSSKRAKVTTAVLMAMMVATTVGVTVWQNRRQAELQDALSAFAMDLDAERGTRAALEENLTNIQSRYDSLLRAVAESAARQETAATLRRDLVARAAGGVGLIVYAYGFTKRNSDLLLRYRVDERGNRATRLSRFGQVVPVLDFGGSGPPLVRQGSATGFLVDSTGWIVTNRHVAEPWTNDDALEALRDDGFDVEPTFVELEIYFPPGGPAHRLTVTAMSDQADIAIMRTASRALSVPVLRLAPLGTAIAPGMGISFIGYPTGVHNLLFRIAEDDRVDILRTVGEEPLDLARELARRRQIQPLVTGGSISDTTSAELIHTASATGGGSGGPILGEAGTVVGIHYAAVRSPIRGDPFQTQRGVRTRYAWRLLPLSLRQRLEGS